MAVAVANAAVARRMATAAGTALAAECGSACPAAALAGARGSRFADPLAAAASLAAGAVAHRKNLPVPPARPVANAAVLPSVGSAVG